MPDWIVNTIACHASDSHHSAILSGIYLARLLLQELHRQCNNRDLLFHVSMINVLLVQLRQSMRTACWPRVVFLILILLNHFGVLLSQWQWERRKMGSHCQRTLEHVRADSISQWIV